MNLCQVEWFYQQSQCVILPNYVIMGGFTLYHILYRSQFIGLSRVDLATNVETATVIFNPASSPIIILHTPIERWYASTLGRVFSPFDP